MSCQTRNRVTIYHLLQHSISKSIKLNRLLTLALNNNVEIQRLVYIYIDRVCCRHEIIYWSSRTIFHAFLQRGGSQVVEPAHARHAIEYKIDIGSGFVSGQKSKVRQVDRQAGRDGRVDGRVDGVWNWSDTDDKQHRR